MRSLQSAIRDVLECSDTYAADCARQICDQLQYQGGVAEYLLVECDGAS